MEWLGYAGTFLLGGGVGTYAGYVISPKADRERQKLEREKWEAEQTAHVRQRRVESLERLQELLMEARSLNMRYPLDDYGPELFTELNPTLILPLLEHIERLKSGDWLPEEATNALGEMAKTVALWTVHKSGVPPTTAAQKKRMSSFHEHVGAAQEVVRRLLLEV